MPPDLTRPHVARIADYWLGGQHNFSIDRKAAERTGPLSALLQQAYIAQRTFMKRAIAYLIYRHDIRHFIDFGSALPTCGNVHEIALEYHPEAVVLYSDIDPTVIEFGRDILEQAALANVRYEWADASRPEELLNSPAVQELLGDERRVGFGFVTLPHLLSDEQLIHSARQLYDWAAEGSHTVVSFTNDLWLRHETLRSRQSRVTQLYYRTAERTVELMQPWQVTEHGVTHASWPDQTVPDNVASAAHEVFLARK